MKKLWPLLIVLLAACEADHTRKEPSFVTEARQHCAVSANADYQVTATWPDGPNATYHDVFFTGYGSVRVREPVGFPICFPDG